MEEIEGDPESAEYDCEGIVYPPSPPQLPEMESFYDIRFLPSRSCLSTSIQYYHDAQGGLTIPVNLIDACGGSDNLAWLAHQYAEYEIEVWEKVLETIDFENLRLDIDIAAYILRSMVLEYEYDSYEILEEGFIPKVLARFFQKLQNKKDDALPDSFVMPNLAQLAQTIKDRFVQLLNEGKIRKLQIQFNDAYYRQDWVEVQKLWPVFTKFQRLLISTERIREISQKYPQAKPPLKGPDYEFGKEKPIDYTELLEKSWECYEKRSDAHYDRIYLSHKTRMLKYSSSRHVCKEATFDMTQLLGELETVGRAIKRALTNIGKSSGNKTNVMTPTLCFVVTDRPHRKNTDHKRIFVPVNLDLFYENDLPILSNNNSYLSFDGELDRQAFNKEEVERTKAIIKEVIPEDSRLNKALEERDCQLPSSLGKSGIDEGAYKIPSIAIADGVIVEKTDKQPDSGAGQSEQKESTSGDRSSEGNLGVPSELLRVARSSYPHLISKDASDGVFEIKDEEEKNIYLKKQANRDYQAGRKAMGKEEIGDISGEHNSKLYHSERVILEILRHPFRVKNLVALLSRELEYYLGHSLEEGQYKVYAVALLTYSTNSICNYCTPSLISLQNSHKEGFLKNLSDELNADNSNFKTGGYDKENHHQIPEKLPMLTIVTSDVPWTEQAHELREKYTHTPKESKIMENPRGFLYLAKNAIDLRVPGWNKEGIRYTHHRTLVEFVNAKFSQRHSAKKTFFFTGNSFMSGSKKEKFSDQVNALNIKIANIMSMKHQEKVTRCGEYGKEHQEDLNQSPKQTRG